MADPVIDVASGDEGAHISGLHVCTAYIRDAWGDPFQYEHAAIMTDTGRVVLSLCKEVADGTETLVVPLIRSSPSGDKFRKGPPEAEFPTDAGGETEEGGGPDAPFPIVSGTDAVVWMVETEPTLHAGVWVWDVCSIHAKTEEGAESDYCAVFEDEEGTMAVTCGCADVPPFVVVLEDGVPSGGCVAAFAYPYHAIAHAHVSDPHTFVVLCTNAQTRTQLWAHRVSMPGVPAKVGEVPSTPTCTTAALSLRSDGAALLALGDSVVHVLKGGGDLPVHTATIVLPGAVYGCCWTHFGTVLVCYAGTTGSFGTHIRECTTEGVELVDWVVCDPCTGLRIAKPFRVSCVPGFGVCVFDTQDVHVFGFMGRMGAAT